MKKAIYVVLKPHEGKLIIEGFARRISGTQWGVVSATWRLNQNKLANRKLSINMPAILVTHDEVDIYISLTEKNIPKYTYLESAEVLTELKDPADVSIVRCIKESVNIINEMEDVALVHNGLGGVDEQPIYDFVRHYYPNFKPTKEGHMSPEKTVSPKPAMAYIYLLLGDNGIGDIVVTKRIKHTLRCHTPGCLVTEKLNLPNTLFCEVIEDFVTVAYLSTKDVLPNNFTWTDGELGHLDTTPFVRNSIVVTLAKLTAICHGEFTADTTSLFSKEYLDVEDKVFLTPLELKRFFNIVAVNTTETTTTTKDIYYQIADVRREMDKKRREINELQSKLMALENQLNQSLRTTASHSQVNPYGGYGYPSQVPVYKPY